MGSPAPGCLVMADPRKRQVFPLSPRAFGVATAPVSRMIEKNGAARFLDSAGTVWRIDRIELAKDGISTQIRLRAGLTAPARISLTPEAMSLDGYRSLFLRCLRAYREVTGFEPDDWWPLVAPMADVEAELGRAADLADLHARLRLQPDEDCLDLL